MIKCPTCGDTLLRPLAEHHEFKDCCKDFMMGKGNWNGLITGLEWATSPEGYKSSTALEFSYDVSPKGRLVIYWQRNDDSVCQIEGDYFDQQAACEMAQEHHLAVRANGMSEEPNALWHVALMADWKHNGVSPSYIAPDKVSEETRARFQAIAYAVTDAILSQAEAERKAV